MMVAADDGNGVALKFGCPLGHLSVKHLSNTIGTPDLFQTKRSILRRQDLTKKLADAVRSSKLGFSLLPAGTYELWARESRKLNPYAPSGYEAVFPIPADRNATEGLRLVAALGGPLAKWLWRQHLAYFGSGMRHRAAARETLKILAKDTMLTVRLDQPSPASGEESKSGRLMISAEGRAALISYQSLQERFESEEEISRINQLLVAKPALIETILGIQWAICEVLREMLVTDATMADDFIAFGEIADLDDKGCVIPSSRFLKIILHNLSPYFEQFIECTPIDILAKSAKAAFDDGRFVQMVSLFRPSETGYEFGGIEERRCPARLHFAMLLVAFFNKENAT